MFECSIYSVCIHIPGTMYPFCYLFTIACEYENDSKELFMLSECVRAVDARMCQVKCLQLAMHTDTLQNAFAMNGNAFCLAPR